VQTINSNHQLPIAENVLQRNFSADAPNQSWVGDITYLRTRQGWLYIALLVDLYSHKIVGWAVSNSMRTDLPLSALRMALLRRRPDLDWSITQIEAFSMRAKNTAGLLRSMEWCAAGVAEAIAGEVPLERAFFPRFKDDSAYRQDWESKAQAGVSEILCMG
jgi:hypothetical protein